MFRNVVAQDLQRTLNACPRGNRGLRGTTKVGVIEVSQTVCVCPNFLAGTALFPHLDRLNNADLLQQLANGFAITQNHAILPTNLARLGCNTKPAGSANKRQRNLRARAHDL